MSSGARNAIMAKARAMYGKRITPEQYQEMCACKSVNEVAAYLKNKTHFASSLSGIAEGNIHRGQLENLLRRSVFEDYSRLCRYLSGKGNKFFEQMIVEEQMEEILRMVLLLKANEADSYILDLPAYLLKGDGVDLMAVAKAKTLDELIHVLSGTGYDEILKKFRSEEGQPVHFMECEHMFWENFFRKTFRIIQKNFKGAERKELMEVFKLRIELLNINHIIRSKVYFDMPGERIVSMLFPYYYRLTPKILEEMIYAKDREQLFSVFSKTFYGKSGLVQDHLEYIEDLTNRIFYRIFRKHLHISPYASVTFFTYLSISKLELSNVFNIIEGIRYQISEEEIKKMIIV